MIVATKHKESFTVEEMQRLDLMFPDHHIRYEMRSIPDHAHAHVEEKL